jgi:mRNA deadenylase 3'-5' endonuclease subunit Ccr4
MLEFNDIHLLSILCFHVLIALSYTKDNFVRVDDATVAYETRKWRILEQILLHQPDLISLEEMDIYDCFLKEHLPRYG